MVLLVLGFAVGVGLLHGFSLAWCLTSGVCCWRVFVLCLVAFGEIVLLGIMFDNSGVASAWFFVVGCGFGIVMFYWLLLLLCCRCVCLLVLFELLCFVG